MDGVHEGSGVLCGKLVPGGESLGGACFCGSVVVKEARRSGLGFEVLVDGGDLVVEEVCQGVAKFVGLGDVVFGG